MSNAAALPPRSLIQSLRSFASGLGCSTPLRLSDQTPPTTPARTAASLKSLRISRGAISSLFQHNQFFLGAQFDPQTPEMDTILQNESLYSLLKSTFPNCPAIEPSSTPDLNSISATIFNTTYIEAEKAELSQWSITATHIASSTEDAAKTAERLSTLNTHLATRTTLLGAKPSVADIAMFHQLSPVVSKWSPDERTGAHGHHHIVRFVDFVQNAPLYGPLKLESSQKVDIDPNNVVSPLKPIDAKAEKERKKKEKEALAAAGATQAAAAGGTATNIAAPDAKENAEPKSKKDKVRDKAEKLGDAVAGALPVAKQGKKEKKEKAPKAPKPAPVEKPLSPALIDLRVGHILKAKRHPNADSLYVSTIACGDAAGTDNTSEYEGKVVRTVCSGLNGLVPLEEMQGRKVVAVCNLKPVTMRGIKSCAMVLAASPREEGDGHKGPVELVDLPEGAEAGDKVYFEGWDGESEAQLNPKKKVWETIQPGFTTTDDLEAGFKVDDVPQLTGEGDNKKTGTSKLITKAGVCKVKSLKGAAIK